VNIPSDRRAPFIDILCCFRGCYGSTLHMFFFSLHQKFYLFFFSHKKRMHERRVELAKYLYDEVSTKGYYVVIKESKVRSRQI